jgi:prevent-host-death family protein
MPAVGIRELKSKTSEIIERVEKGEAFLVTKRGRGVSVLLPFGEDVEDMILARAPEFVRLWQRGRKEYEQGRTVPWTKLKKELLAEKPERRVARRAR